MKLALVTDAWKPQVNGVVTTLIEVTQVLRREGHVIEVIEPGQFRTRPCPGYPGIDLAVRPGKELETRLAAFDPDAIHIATEGPLGWAARRYCLRRRLAFSTAFHTKFPELLYAALKIPRALGYAVLRHFHRPSSAVMVPTQGVLRMLEQRGFRNLRGWTHGVDAHAFTYRPQVQPYSPLGPLVHPVQLFVGRLSHEKNVEAFLRLNTPGSKVVCGVGPLQEVLRERHPSVHWLGVLSREELAKAYAAADVFVFPSCSETFGLVMLEAMACGTPVAAYPVDGPLEVLGGEGLEARGGFLDEDLAKACLGAIAVPRHEARARALEFSWVHATRVFASHLVPVRHRPASPMGQTERIVTPLS